TAAARCRWRDRERACRTRTGARRIRWDDCARTRDAASSTAPVPAVPAPEGEQERSTSTTLLRRARRAPDRHLEERLGFVARRRRRPAGGAGATDEHFEDEPVLGERGAAGSQR